MKRHAPEWLLNAVIYQIYPQSFYDSNGDGIGDLPGITEKLDYIQSLGVTAIWINPFFDSPFNDGGYDVADYYKVAPRYGTNEDFKTLCVIAKKRGIKVIFDLVAGHTSWANQWFIESAKADRNEYSDWYIWTNNVWTEENGIIRGLYPRFGGYLPNFLPSQPALNYGYAIPDPSKPWQLSTTDPGPMAVRAELRKIIKFWFDSGADGFRADMALSLVKGDLNGDFTSIIWQDIRKWIDTDYPDHVMIGEGGIPDISIKKAGFHIDFTLPWSMPKYNSLFRKAFPNEGGINAGVDKYASSVFDKSGHGNILEFLDEFAIRYKETKDYGFISIVEGNHDLHPRISYGRTDKEVLQVFLFTMTMPGIPFLYYGDEIGIKSVDGLPGKEGSFDRSNIRTPMQWDNTKVNAGFSTAPMEKLFLPINPEGNRPAVASEEINPASLLNQTKKLIELKRNLKALEADASWEVLYAESGKMPLIYKRSKGSQTLIIAINPTDQNVVASIKINNLKTKPVTLWGQDKAFSNKGDEWTISLEPASGGIYEILK
jgi:maltose alpha-D-glucosyltransferase/alpha-amylase